MHFTKKSSSEIRKELTEKLKNNKILKFPGAYNPLTAKLIAEISFDGIYISGAVMANDLGIPDIGLTTLKEVSYRAKQISRVTDLPSICVWALFGSSIKLIIKNTKIKKIIEYLLALLLAITAVIIVID